MPENLKTKTPTSAPMMADAQDVASKPPITRIPSIMTPRPTARPQPLPMLPPELELDLDVLLCEELSGV